MASCVDFEFYQQASSSLLLISCRMINFHDTSISVFLSLDPQKKEYGERKYEAIGPVA